MTSIASFGMLASTGLQRLAALFADRGAALRELDARTLADIGIDASEISSVEAEWLGDAEVTRRRIAAW
jgi:hypothetical protein